MKLIYEEKKPGDINLMTLSLEALSKNKPHVETKEIMFA
jgi:hypothetical protein